MWLVQILGIIVIIFKMLFNYISIFLQLASKEG